MFDQGGIRRALDNLDRLPLGEQRALLEMLEERDKLLHLQLCRDKFLPYVEEIWPSFIAGPHHTLMAEAFEDVANGKCKRLIINIAPRHTKSELASFALPSWFIGKFPRKKIIQIANIVDLAAGFGRKVRNLVAGEVNEEGLNPYREIFPDVSLAADSTAAALWSTNKGGQYFAVGVNGKVTGRGADILIVDDPHALEVSTEIPTPNGFVRVDELVVGDEVFGPDGLPTKIIAKSEVWHDRELYRVRASDGQSVLCDAAHLWNYRSDTKVTAPFRTASAHELSKWVKVSAPIIPSYRPIQYPVRDLLIDPYVLGAWLGDGTSSAGRMTCHPDDRPYMLEQFHVAGYETTDQADPYNFGVLKLWPQLKTLGLLNNKHVPETYLTASVEQRLALLQGLMDTDGNVTTEGQCSFNNTNFRLAGAVRELVHSLGVRATLREIGTMRENEAQIYRVNFKLADAARMPRKRERTYTTEFKRGRSIEVVREEIFGSVQCITVDRQDGLFLAGRGYIVTHNSEQEAKDAQVNPSVFDNVYDWYSSGPRQRLQPGGSIIIVMTRWGKRDLTGQVLRKEEEDRREGLKYADQWRVIELPAVLDENTPTERSLWPAFWPLDELRATRNALPPAKWQAQYQQNPTSEESTILKRSYWRRWGEVGKPPPHPDHAEAWRDGDPPPCIFTIQSWDCAATKNDRSNYSACTTWGVFVSEDSNTGKEVNNVILLSAYRGRLTFPELKKKAKRFYDEDQPDSLLIENKSAGIQLIQEFRAMGMPVQDFSFGRGTQKVSNDKIARANMVSDMFASGYVWAPSRRWAEEVITECAEFPNGEFDDYVDSTVQAMIRFRIGKLIGTTSDKSLEKPRKRKRKRYY